MPRYLHTLFVCLLCTGCPAPKGDGAKTPSKASVALPEITTRKDTPPDCPPGMVHIPSGRYVMKGAKLEVAVNAFCLDATEVTIKSYTTCTHCKPPSEKITLVGFDKKEVEKLESACNLAFSDRTDHPVNCVDLVQAKTYCQFAGKRLPSEEEWEWAARSGQNAFDFSWGSDGPSAQLCWNGEGNSAGTHQRKSSCAVGQFAPNSFGLKDVSGNVSEWTSSSTVPGGVSYVIRGGNWNSYLPLHVSTHDRGAELATTQLPTLGFRCAR